MVMDCVKGTIFLRGGLKLSGQNGDGKIHGKSVGTGKIRVMTYVIGTIYLTESVGMGIEGAAATHPSTAK